MVNDGAKRPTDGAGTVCEGQSVWAYRARTGGEVRTRRASDWRQRRALCQASSCNGKSTTDRWSVVITSRSVLGGRKEEECAITEGASAQ